MTHYLLKKALYKPDTSRRLINWSVELREFNIEYIPWVGIKGQVVVEFTNPPLEGEGGKSEGLTWVIYMDGSTKRSSGAGIVLTSLAQG